jgi:hypothetical protein
MIGYFFKIIVGVFFFLKHGLDVYWIYEDEFFYRAELLGHLG